MADEVAGHAVILNTDDMANRETWPHPWDPRDVQWGLRYAPDQLDPAQRAYAAQAIAAYEALIFISQRRRNHVCSAIRRAVEASASKEPK